MSSMTFNTVATVLGDRQKPNYVHPFAEPSTLQVLWTNKVLKLTAYLAGKSKQVKM
jgi:hypothetical protein